MNTSVVIVGMHLLGPDAAEVINLFALIGDRIVTITEGEISGTRTVDATGHAVVPGEEVTCTAVLEV